jgi:hypothetical protein
MHSHKNPICKPAPFYVSRQPPNLRGSILRTNQLSCKLLGDAPRVDSVRLQRVVGLHNVTRNMSQRSSAPPFDWCAHSMRIKSSSVVIPPAIVFSETNSQLDT